MVWRRARLALRLPVPEASMRGGWSCRCVEVLADHCRRFRYPRGHARGIGDPRLRHVRLATALPASGGGELAKNRVGADGAITQVVGDDDEHRVLAILESCGEH